MKRKSWNEEQLNRQFFALARDFKQAKTPKMRMKITKAMLKIAEYLEPRKQSTEESR
ncbi:hypothetical protein [Acetobacterium wieringae]|uniref:hypothetical protein n=1 Tax=Acetobacterium wieringae TaxID=52694 RepID=UPI001E624A27|nr:hypothetical protein [Acetobacterium wieringae]